MLVHYILIIFLIGMATWLYHEQVKDSKPTKATKVVVVDENGRSYVNDNKNNVVHISYEDENKTLTVFIHKKHK